MGRFIKFVVIGIASLLLLLVAAVAIFMVTFDADDLKQQIVDSVKEETGRELSIEGDVHLSVFPYVGF
ncbi:MAG: AsmA family protein, partial [Pseudomonadota bacterium]